MAWMYDAGVGLDRGEREPLVACGRSGCRPCEVVEDRLLEGRSAVGVLGSPQWSSCRNGAAGKGQGAVRRQALDGERAGDPDLLLVLVGLVVEQLEVGVPLDRRVDLARGSSPP